ncbi:Fur family transcriptional regulator [Opitutales bacterium ASA1]|uniref:Fur family transcriptional regulator n=1 Tax=Congregicoccus parvus TaxID=3081749 RepID=UPI002B2AB537|nr:Fur family transcriptional regulator [Opitutales bacterium ASA1]
MAERSSDQLTAMLEQASDGWKAQGSRMTYVRRVVCETAFRFTCPFDAEELIARTRLVDRSVSPASVYRTLNQLRDLGMLREVPSARSGHRAFAVVEGTGASAISHVVCADCAQVIPLPDPCLPLREGALARQHGFNPKAMTLRVEATCDELHTKGTCARRK